MPLALLFLLAAAAAADATTHAIRLVGAARELREKKCKPTTATVGSIHLGMGRERPKLPALRPGGLQRSEGIHPDRRAASEPKLDLAKRGGVQGLAFPRNAEMELVVSEAGRQEDGRKALILDGESNQVVVPRDSPVAHPSLARDLEES